MKIRRVLPLLIALALLTAACNRTPAPVLDEEKLARLLVDLELADAYSDEQRVKVFDNDSIRLALRESVLAKHNVNEATLDTSLRWYGAHLPLLIKVYERADSILSDSVRAIDLEERTMLAAAAGDSTQMWRLAPSLPMEDSDFLSFELEADSTWERGDVFEWKFAIHNLRREPVSVTLGAEYKDRAQTVNAQSMTRENRDNNHYSLLLQLDRQKSPKRIFGYVRIPLDSGRRVFVDSITLTRTRLVEEDYYSRRYRLRILEHNKPL